uniref:Ovule protein n=1 Tax=Strongyloides stercoralis TaxID=6248 RepID=A0A0K0EJN4_STRER
MFQKSIEVYRNEFYVFTTLKVYIFFYHMLCWRHATKMKVKLPKACFSKLYSSRQLGLLLVITLGFFYKYASIGKFRKYCFYSTDVNQHRKKHVG